MAQTGLALNSKATVAAPPPAPHPLTYDAAMAKRSEKPKKAQKQQPQKTLKEKRAEKRAAKKHGSGV